MFDHAQVMEKLPKITEPTTKSYWHKSGKKWEIIGNRQRIYKPVIAPGSIPTTKLCLEE